YGHVQIAVEAQVADGSAVDAALHRLQLVDDLHRPYLGRADGRAGGKAGLEHIDGVQARRDAPLDVRDDVHDVRIALDQHFLGHLDASGRGDAADVVAAEVDQHDVLGALLRIGEQLLGDRGVLLGCTAPRPTARDGAQGDGVRGEPDQDL